MPDLPVRVEILRREVLFLTVKEIFALVVLTLAVG